MTVPTERLYNLLPAVYRVRDVAQGEPLRALMAVMEGELRLLEDDLDRLYENWFIETCDEWVVPYIGDLLGVRGILPVQNGAFSQRGRVANTLGYRRRKGTVAMLEQLARDVTGYPAKVVEFFELLGATQYLNHVRPGKGGTVDLGNANQLELINTSFDPHAHTVDVRHIDNGRGKYNIEHVGVYLWRLQSYGISRVTARLIPETNRYTFSPLGHDQPLFNAPRTETTITQLADEPNVPTPLRRRALHDEIVAAREAISAGKMPRFVYLGRDPVIEVFVRDPGDDLYTQIQPENIQICNLTGTHQPEAPIEVAVDPVLGRLAFPSGITHERVQVSYSYGFSGDLGGGPYNRRASVAAWLDPRDGRPAWQLGIHQDAPDDPGDPRFDPQLRGTLAAAIEEWHAQPPGTLGIIAITDNGSYTANISAANAIRVPAGSTLAIVGADWPQHEHPDLPGQPWRIPKDLIAANVRPHIEGNLAVRGTAPVDSVNPGELIIDGLLIEGGLLIPVGNLRRVRVLHTTLVPGSGGITVNPSTQRGQQNDQLEIDLVRSICGPVKLADTNRRLELTDSIIDGGGSAAIAAPAARIENSTIIGTTTVQTLQASESVFTERVTVARRQIGCVRYCYLPLGSLAPRRFHCQPTGAATAKSVFPHFTSLTYGHPGYGQLAATCPAEIATGAEDENEIGAFHFLQHSQRVRNLRASLDEYLRFGLEAGVFLVT